MANRVLHSMTPHDRDKVIALLKSVAADCDGVSDEHSWRHCRHCLAMEEFNNADIRHLLGEFIATVKK